MAVMYGLLLLSVLAVLPTPTFECATNGLCGYQCGYAPAAPPPCSCQRSYSCGSYGCYRMRARGAKSYQPVRHRTRVHASSSSQSSLESDRLVLKENSEEEMDTQEMLKEKVKRRQRLSESEEVAFMAPSVAENRRRRAGVDPNKAFYECCVDRKLPDACIAKCNFGVYNKQSLQAMYFKQDPCPLEAMKEMQFCAAQGRDHTECCARNGVTTTLAGPKCLMFCDQRVGSETRLDMSFVPCFDRFESMKSCFWHDLTRFYKV